MKDESAHQEMIAKLHTADHKAAHEAVDYFVARRIPAPLIERLKVGGNDVRIAAVRGLAAIGEKEALPALADLLEAERHPVKGSEEATIHKILKQTALRTAAQLMGESFEIEDINDEQAVMAVVRRMRETQGRT